MSSKMSVKLLVDKKSQKVVFAEAGKEFVDFLFNLLAMPVGTVAKLLKKDRMVGSIGNLYNSVESLSEAYLEPNKPNKSTASLLQLQLPTSQRPLLLSNPTTPKSEGTLYYFRCYSHKSHTYVTHNSGTLCPICLHQMTTQMTYVGTGTAHMNKPGGDEGSIVRGVVTYMIMDDLSVTPMSTISGVKTSKQVQY